MIKIAPNLRRELAPTGQLRATINLGNTVLAQSNQQTGRRLVVLTNERALHGTCNGEGFVLPVIEEANLPNGHYDTIYLAGREGRQ